MWLQKIQRSAATSFFQGTLKTITSFWGEKEDTSRGCGGYYRDQGDSRPTFEMTVLFFVHGRLYKSELTGDPPRALSGAAEEGGGKEILKHVFATFRARYRENSWWKVGPVDRGDPYEDKSWETAENPCDATQDEKSVCALVQLNRWEKKKRECVGGRKYVNFRRRFIICS